MIFSRFTKSRTVFLYFCKTAAEKGLYERSKLLYNVIYIKLGVCDMNCMRCGRDIEDGQVFCAQCLEVMKKSPVNPGTAIRIPHRPDPQLRRTVRRKQVSEEEQIRILRKRLRIMAWLFAITLAALIALSIPTVIHFTQEHNVLPGQNYSSATDGNSAAD